MRCKARVRLWFLSTLELFKSAGINLRHVGPHLNLQPLDLVLLKDFPMTSGDEEASLLCPLWIVMDLVMAFVMGVDIEQDVLLVSPCRVMSVHRVSPSGFSANKAELHRGILPSLVIVARDVRIVCLIASSHVALGIEGLARQSLARAKQKKARTRPDQRPAGRNNNLLAGQRVAPVIFILERDAVGRIRLSTCNHRPRRRILLLLLLFRRALMALTTSAAPALGLVGGLP